MADGGWRISGLTTSYLRDAC